VNKIKALLEATVPGGLVRNIHTHACQHCPSIHSPDDPECVQIRDRASLEEKIESLFRCAWRSEKACRGYADFIGVTPNDFSCKEAP
jgi:hypothetical protein